MKKILLDDSSIDKIISLFSTNKNITQICLETNIGRRIVERVLQDKSFDIKTKSELIATVIPILNDKEHLLTMYDQQKMSINDIAKQLNTNTQVVKTAFKRFGIAARNNKEARNISIIKEFPKLANYDYLYQEYIKLKKSPNNIALILGCSSKAVETALDNLHIRRRNHQESLKFSTPQQKINAKMARNLRTRFWIALNGKSKMASAVRDLGCTLEEFKQKIEVKFHPNPITGELMSWDNYGINGWEIDHIDPLFSFDLISVDQQKLACHYTNLQPLWRNSNRVKGNKVFGTQPNKVKLYIVCGPAGVGKSWVCDQLQDVNYISYDSVPKEQHYHYMVELSKNSRPIVYDPFRKINTLKRRYSSLFDIRVVLIKETPEVVFERLKGRGSKTIIDEVKKYCDKSNKYAKIAAFTGTSQEVLDYLKKELIVGSNNKEQFEEWVCPVVKNKPTIYLLIGAPAAGKSWVASQLLDKFTYVSYDGNSKKDHINLLRAASDKSKLYDPTFKISTIIKRHSEEFNFVLVGIYEDENTLRTRMASRGGEWTDTIMKRNEVVKARYKKYGAGGFIGTSQEVLDYLRKELV